MLVSWRKKQLNGKYIELLRWRNICCPSALSFDVATIMSISLCLPTAHYLLSASDGGSWCSTTHSTIQLLNYPILNYPTAELSKYQTVLLCSCPLSNFCLQVMAEARAILVQLTLPPYNPLSNNIKKYHRNIPCHPPICYPDIQLPADFGRWTCALK